MTYLLNSYGKETPHIVKDLDGVEVNPGDLVEVQHCNGRYGQTAKVCGTFEKATSFGVYLTFDAPYTNYNGRCGSYTYKAGESVMFALHHDEGKFYNRHNDIEHGHVTYMKRLQIPQTESSSA